MRRVEPPERPRGWQTHVLKAGRKWLKAGNNRSAERPRGLWREPPFEGVIAESFDYICCYSTVFVANGQADHFVPWARVRGTRQAWRAYEWSNIRYADGWLNSSRRTVAFPDPFEVEDDWFELHLPSLELRATDEVPTYHQEAVDNLIRRVGRDPRVMKVRRRYFEKYQKGECPLDVVDELVPLLGRALRANPGYLAAADRPGAM